MVEAWKPGSTPWVGEVDAPAPALVAATSVAAAAVVAAALLVT